MNERRLTEQLSKGDTAALEKIIRKYTGYVSTIAFNFSRNMLTNEDIDDITADVFYRLWKARERLNAQIGLRSYLSAIVRNAVRYHLKKMPPPAEDISELELSDDFLVEDAAELHDITACLNEGVSLLSEDEREIFIRFYYNGEKASRIAQEKGISKGAVDTRLYRIRNKLKKYLAERGYDNV